MPKNLPSSATGINRRPPSKLKVLSLILAILGIIGCVYGYMRRDAIRERWLESRTLEELQAMGAQPDADALTHYLVAERLVRVGRPQEAVTPAALAAKDVSAPAWVVSDFTGRALALAGYLEAEYGSTANAEATLNAAEHAGSRDTTLHLGRGILAIRRRQLAKAVAEFTVAARLNPERAECWSRLASALTRGAVPEAALAALRHAAVIDPDNPQIHADLAELFGRLGQFDDAARECRRAAELGPDNPTFEVLPAVGQASSARSEADYTAAVQQLGLTMGRLPQVDFLHELLAGLHFRFGRFTLARQELEPYLARNPSDSDGWLNLSAVCDKIGDSKCSASAFSEYQRLIDIQSAPVELTKQALMHQDDPEIFVKLSAASQRAGKIRDAYGALQHASALKPLDQKIADAAARMRSEMDAAADSTMPGGVGGRTP